MANRLKVDKDTEELLERFFRRYDIRSLQVSKGLGITNLTEISDISMHLIKDRSNPNDDYLVEFKLQRDCADMHLYLESIETEPSFSVKLASNPWHLCRSWRALVHRNPLNCAKPTQS